MGRGMPPQMGRGMPMGSGMPMGRGMPQNQRGMPGRMQLGPGMPQNSNPAMPGRGMPGQPVGPMMRPGQQIPGAPQGMGQGQNTTAQEEEEKPKADPFASMFSGTAIGKQLAAARQKTPEPNLDLAGPAGVGMDSALGMQNSQPNSSMSSNQPGVSSSSLDKYSETSKLRNLLRGAEEAERKAKQDNFKLREQVEIMERQVKEMKGQFDVWQQQSQQVGLERQQHQQILQQNEVLKINCEQWQTQHQEQAQQIEKLNHELTELRDQLAMTKDFQSEKENLLAQINGANQRAMSAEEQLADREREIFSLNREKTALLDDLEHFRKPGAPVIQTQLGAPTRDFASPSQPDSLTTKKIDDLGFGTFSAPQPEPKPQTNYHEYKRGDQVVRKGQICTITKIDNSIEPPDVTIKVNSTGQIIGTEFTKIKKYEPEKDQLEFQPNPNLVQSAANINLQPQPAIVPQEPVKPAIQPAPVAEPTPQPNTSQPQIPELTMETMKSYEKYFAQADTNKDGLVDGQEAFSFFQKSGLDRQSLANIWRLIDVGVKGKLSKAQFFCMFHVVISARKIPNFTVPPQLPPHLEEPHLLSLLNPANQSEGWDAF